MLCGGSGGDHQIFPKELREQVTAPALTLPRSPGHHREWVDAIKGGKPASSNFEYGAKLTEIVLLGLLALRTGQVVRWDAPAMKAIGVPEADAILNETYRDGWKLDA
jgi:hypothetical protein